MISRHPAHVVTNAQILLHHRTAQIDIAMSQAYVLAHRRVIFDEERRRHGRVQHLELVHHQLDHAGIHLRIDGVLGARLQHPAHANDELAAQIVRRLMRRATDVGVENDLDDAGAVAKVDKDHATVIASSIDPSGQDQFLAGIGFAGFTAITATLHLMFPLPCSCSPTSSPRRLRAGNNPYDRRARPSRARSPHLRPVRRLRR